MKEFIKNYLKVLSYVFTGLVFILASFYLIINYNHSEEIKKTIYIGSGDLNYQKQKEMLEEINQNLIKYNAKKINNSLYNNLANGLNNCYQVLQKDGTLMAISTDTDYGPIEIHKLGSNYQNIVMNECYVLNLSFLKNDEVDLDYKSFITSYVNSINENVSDALAEIENNSSYFFSTNITSATIRNYLLSDYKTIANAYNDFTEILVNLSKIINEGGNND